MPSAEASRKNWGSAVEGIKAKAKQRKMEHAKNVLAQYRNAVKKEDEDMEERIKQIEEKNLAKDIITEQDNDSPEEKSESEDEVDFTDIIAEKMAKMKIKRAKAESKRAKKKKTEPQPEESESESEESEEEEPVKKTKSKKSSSVSVKVYNQSSGGAKKEKNNEEISRMFLKF